MKTILAIESSCDETSAAILVDGILISNVIATQALHSQYGGVVPELASREHQKNIYRVVEQALREASITVENIDAVAYTRGPGLMGSLLVGSAFAKGLSQALNVPLLPINHLKAHILALFVNEPSPSFPFLCLLVSGGHTQIIKVNSVDEFDLLGQTLDDAAGEAFDKVAKLLNLPYPGGPLIDKLAQNGNEDVFKFTIPNVPGFDYSFSGFKTSILNFLQKQKKSNPNFIEENLPDICASVQKTIVNILLDKYLRAIEDIGIQCFAVSGGVAANSRLKQALAKYAEDNNKHFFVPPLKLCTDNAGMIALAAWRSQKKEEKQDKISEAKGGLGA